MNRFFNKAASVITALSLLMVIFPTAAFADDKNGSTDYDMSKCAMTVENYRELDISPSVFPADEGLKYTNRRPQILAGSGSDSYNFGDYLDRNNRAVYNAFAKLVDPSLASFTVDLPETIVFTSKTEPPSDDDYFDAVFGACESGMDAASYDYPMLFWLDRNATSVFSEDMTCTFSNQTRLYTYTIGSLTFEPRMISGLSSMIEIKSYMAKLKAAANAFEVTGSTRAEMLRCIHDRIAEFTYYDSDGIFAGNCLSAYVTPGSVCEGYSKGFKLMCDRLGIPCVCVFGNYDPGTSEAHMWNYVQLEDGNWYAVDLTWDDTDDSDIVGHDYFLKGAESFAKEHTPCAEYLSVKLVYPILTESDLPVEPEYQYGDLNHDGKVSIADLIYCASDILNISKAEYSCDLNNDGYADVYDVVLMRKLIYDIMMQAVSDPIR